MLKRSTKKRDLLLKKEIDRFPEVDRWLWCARALSASWQGQNWTPSLGWLLKRGNGTALEEWMQNGELMERGQYPPQKQQKELTGVAKTMAIAAEYRRQGL